MAQDPQAVPQADDDNAGGVSKEEADALYAKLTGQPHAAQANFFLNVHWEKLGDNKETVFAILALFTEQGEDKKGISGIAFMKVLQDLENKHKVIADFPNDGPSISKKFENSGIKKKGEIPILGALLAIFEVTLIDTANAPATPCNAQLRNAQKTLEDTKNVEGSLLKQKAAIEKEIEEMNAAHASALKVMKKREALQKVTKQLDDDARKVKLYFLSYFFL